VDLIPTEAKSFQYAHCKMLPTSFLQSSFFEGLGKYLSRKGLQVCGASCRQAMELAYNSSAWRSVDFSQWSPLGGHTEPGDIDLMLALKRLRHGSLRCVLLESSRISHHAFKELLTIQSQIEKLVIRSPPASARAFASAHQLKHLELLGPSTLLCAEAKRLETLVLHLPSLSDLQAIPKFKTLKMLEVFPPAISFSSHGQLTPPEPFKEALLQIFQSCKQLEHVRLWGIYNACDNLMLRALSHLDLQELHGYYLEDVDNRLLNELKRKCKVHLDIVP